MYGTMTLRLVFALKTCSKSTKDRILKTDVAGFLFKGYTGYTARFFSSNPAAVQDFLQMHHGPKKAGASTEDLFCDDDGARRDVPRRIHRMDSEPKQLRPGRSGFPVWMPCLEKVGSLSKVPVYDG